MQIKINRKDKTAIAIKDNKVIKSKELSPEEFKSTMAELCGDSLETVRLATKLFKVKSFTFSNMRKG